jgi:hypothetical protein
MSQESKIADVVIRIRRRQPNYVHVIPVSARAAELLTEGSVERTEWNALRADVERRGWTWEEESA